MKNERDLIAVSFERQTFYVSVLHDSAKIGDEYEISAISKTGIVVDCVYDICGDVLRMVSRTNTIYYGSGKKNGEV